MIGGDDDMSTTSTHLRDHRPGGAARRALPGPPGSRRRPSRVLHCGPNGAGHFVKMVHNGIEYGMMASLAEGLNILQRQRRKTPGRDAETAPLEYPEFYQYDIDTTAVAEVWRRGSVIESWLLDLTAAALFDTPPSTNTPAASRTPARAVDLLAAIEEGVPAPVLTAALYSRFASRGDDDFADKVLSAMRKGFGGHDEKPR